jgi:thiol-disulfide isomerase/thioredoxin
MQDNSTMSTTIIDRERLRTLLKFSCASAGVAIGFLIATSQADSVSNSTPKSVTVTEQITDLRQQVDAAKARYDDAFQRGPAYQTEAGKAWEAYSAAFETNLPKILKVVHQNAASSNSFEMLLWITSHRAFGGNQALSNALEPLQLLGQFHAAKSGLAPLCSKCGSWWSWRWRDRPIVDFLEAVREQNPDRATRGQAILALARLDKDKAGYLIDWENDLANDSSNPKARAEYADIAKTADSKKILQEAEQLFDEVIKDYGDCPFVPVMPSRRPGTTLSEQAGGDLFGLLHLTIGQVAPELKGQDFDDHEIKLSNYRGKVVVINFWAAWCGPCMAAVPHERKLAERMRGKPFVLIGVNGDYEKSAAQNAIEKEKMTWPSMWAGTNGPYSQLAKEWNVKAWPTFYILDRSGTIRSKFSGMREKELDIAVDRLMAEATKNPLRD